jgi:hypothetical protein
MRFWAAASESHKGEPWRNNSTWASSSHDGEWPQCALKFLDASEHGVEEPNRDEAKDFVTVQIMGLLRLMALPV